MNKTIKHIWRYLTSPIYRYWVDICVREKYIDINLKLLKDNWQLGNHFMYFDNVVIPQMSEEY